MPVLPLATVAAKVCISATGEVTEVTISRGVSLFDDAVRDAVSHWRYEPYRVGDRPIPVCFPVYFNFNVRE